MKPIFKLFVSLFILAVLTACAPPQGQSETAEAIADTLYENGVIWTGKADVENATILATKDGKVFYVGPSKKLSSKTRVDLGGAFIMPGFIDNHVHFMEGGAALSSVDLRDAASPEDFSNRWIPDQKITAEEAMIVYTAANAYAMGEEDIAGTLENGKRADFVVYPKTRAPLTLSIFKT